VKIPEILQVETPHSPGCLASVLNVIAQAGLVLEHVSSVRATKPTLWEITVEIDADAHVGLVERLNALPMHVSSAGRTAFSSGITAARSRCARGFRYPRSKSCATSTHPE